MCHAHTLSNCLAASASFLVQSSRFSHRDLKLSPPTPANDNTLWVSPLDYLQSSCLAFELAIALTANCLRFHFPVGEFECPQISTCQSPVSRLESDLEHELSN